MAKTRIVFSSNGIRQIMRDPRLAKDIERRTSAITSACNDQSSWGGYKQEIDTEGARPVGRIWTIGRSDTPGGDRAFRMIRNLDRGRM